MQAMAKAHAPLRRLHARGLRQGLTKQLMPFYLRYRENAACCTQWGTCLISKPCELIADPPLDTPSYALAASHGQCFLSGYSSTSVSLPTVE